MFWEREKERIHLHFLVKVMAFGLTNTQFLPLIDELCLFSNSRSSLLVDVTMFVQVSLE